MAVDVQTEIVIDRPVAEVAAFASDPSHVPAWYVNIHTVRWLGPPVVALGARVAFVARFLGRELAYTYEIVGYEPGASLVMRTTEGPFPMETRYAFEPIGPNQTRMVLRNHGEPAGFSRLVAPMMAQAMRRANQNDLIKLKQVLEAGAGRA